MTSESNLNHFSTVPLGSTAPAPPAPPAPSRLATNGGLLPSGTSAPPNGPATNPPPHLLNTFQPQSPSTTSILKISNLPHDLTNREASLIFSLVVDDIINIEIKDYQIIAFFKTINTCLTTGKLLEGKFIFGNEYGPIKVDYENLPIHSPNSLSNTTTNFQNLRLSSISNISPPNLNNHLHLHLQASQQSASQPQQQQQPPPPPQQQQSLQQQHPQQQPLQQPLQQQQPPQQPLHQQPLHQQPPDQSAYPPYDTFQKRQSIGNQRSRFLFSDPFSNTSPAANGPPNPAQPPQSAPGINGTVQPSTHAPGSIDLSDLTGKSLLLMESQNDSYNLVTRDPWGNTPLPQSATTSQPGPSQSIGLGSADNSLHSGTHTPFDWSQQQQQQQQQQSAPPSSSSDRRKISSAFFNNPPPSNPQSSSGNSTSQLPALSVPGGSNQQQQQPQQQQPQSTNTAAPSAANPQQQQSQQSQQSASSQQQLQQLQQLQQPSAAQVIAAGPPSTQPPASGIPTNGQPTAADILSSSGGSASGAPTSSNASPATSRQSSSKDIPDLSLLARVPPPANPADQNPPCNTLYVGNLPPDATEAELRSLFAPQKGFRRLSFRTKNQSSANSNASNHNHGPMCFVEFDDVALATRALAELYGSALPRPNGSNGKGGIRLSFSKNPLGVRGPGNPRRTSTNNISTSSSNVNGNANGVGNYGYLNYHQK
ncbi:hypothetical protein HYPBUDRAFT_167785 [Hyphopichia burtonii NRRL Y-1933]|uniref:RRM domain-containing protein n=1 Tax=Hyphopichia burtonii NRRL Y-1933 TaxID=984485 RepID=A0A1E4RF44_9ASCO|nr:hypothetical protein HYPBUDRAFT_167785 [Hyphopichia burtonii NRRL Y-1933]ODV65887.1 hypothetical protein HYPBUDRAFT_167785 [Hyphopichia burtonii NRRL Y-1933]